MVGGEPGELVWRRARCDSGSCVEVALLGDAVAVRNSNDPDGPVLRFTRAEWTTFVNGVKAGDFALSNTSRVEVSSESGDPDS
jgi:Domain of unknown function (DUF397)